jgi:hypothetical protein
MGFCPIPHSSRDQVWLAVGLGLGCTLASLVRRRRARASHPRIHVLLVHVKFESADQKVKWKAVWASAAAAVYAAEPNCLSYEFCDAEDNPFEAIIYERYVPP